MGFRIMKVINGGRNIFDPKIKSIIENNKKSIDIT